MLNPSDFIVKLCNVQMLLFKQFVARWLVQSFQGQRLEELIVNILPP